MHLLGIDLGSSSVKVCLFDSDSRKELASASYPDVEMEILAVKPGYAEQDPAAWMVALQNAMGKLSAKHSLSDVRAVGISYQMHGLVLVGNNGQVLRPSIIWCDSRAVPFGEALSAKVGSLKCLESYLNSPGNFTLSKLLWVQANEPEIYAQIRHVFLPGDWLAYHLTGEAFTTESGLSEGITYNFQTNRLATELLDAAGVDGILYPPAQTSFATTGVIRPEMAAILGLPQGVQITYRAGDQPNNALALAVTKPGQIAANGGTSGVLYGVTDQPKPDPESRVNSFAHVTHTALHPRIGVLACVNGTGIMYSWLRRLLSGAGSAMSYSDINTMASQVPIGADGLLVLPYGNGAERTLANKSTGAQMLGVQLTAHTPAHVARATQEGIAAALYLGMEIMREMGLAPEVIRAGHANMFLSPVFTEAMAGLSGCPVELYSTYGAKGAAIAAGVAVKASNVDEIDQCIERLAIIEPRNQSQYAAYYASWKATLVKALS